VRLSGATCRPESQRLNLLCWPALPRSCVHRNAKSQNPTSKERFSISNFQFPSANLSVRLLRTFGVEDWWVELRPGVEQARVLVMNPKWLAGRLGKISGALDGRQIALVSARLEKQCRDVEE
jgi:hypothetical protein